MVKNPTICNLCGGHVEFITNDKIYGISLGSGFAYRCTKCGAYTGTHKPMPKEDQD
ncbi:MAG: zinc-finger-containing protein [Duodenibacillus sp.]